MWEIIHLNELDEMLMKLNNIFEMDCLSSPFFIKIRSRL